MLEKLEIISLLLSIFIKYPDLRFCQIISNIVSKEYGAIPQDIFYITDKKIISLLKEELI